MADLTDLDMEAAAAFGVTAAEAGAALRAVADVADADADQDVPEPRAGWETAGEPDGPGELAVGEWLRGPEVPAPEPGVAVKAIVDRLELAGIEKLEAATRLLGDEVVRRLRSDVAEMRATRRSELAAGDRPLLPSEVADLVRRLAHAGDVFRHIAGAFAVAAGECDELIASEAIDEVGTDRLVIPDGLDTEIVVAKASGSRRVWHEEHLVPGLAHLAGRVASDELGASVTDEIGDLPPEVVLRAGAAAGIRQVLAHGTVSWRSTDVDSTRRSLMAEGSDDVAGLFDRATERLPTVADRLSVKREAAKKRRRA